MCLFCLLFESSVNVFLRVVVDVLLFRSGTDVKSSISSESRVSRAVVFFCSRAVSVHRD